MTWQVAVLILGAMAAGVVMWRDWTWRRARVSDETVSGLKAECAELRAARDGLSQRLAKVETALRIDGARVMNEAMKNNLPAFMKIALVVVGIGALS